MRVRSEVDETGMYPNALTGSVAVRGRDTGRSVGIVVFVVVLAIAGVFATASSARSFFPKSWDPSVAPIAAKVASLRGLEFVHPVAIRYLAPTDFEKQIGSAGQPTASARAEIQREEAVFRALGFIGGKVDLLKEALTQSTSDTLAYYDPPSQQIFVRGTTLDVAHRVTVAHELTHVLQDQHFDLQKLQQRADDSKVTDGSGLKGLIEGDAVRIEREYLKELSVADHKEFDRENAAESTRIGNETSSVSEILQVLTGAPYEFGPQTVRVLMATGGNRAVDDALTGAPPSSGVFISTGDVSTAVGVTVPAPPPGGVRVGRTEAFGPFETLLTLAPRVDPVVALSAADAVSGGEAVTYRSGGETCYRVSVQPRFPHSRPFLLAAFRSWAKGRSGSTVDSVPNVVQFTACDPGTGAPVPDSKPLNATVALLALRSNLTVGAALAHVSGDRARCVGRVFVAKPGVEKLVIAIGDGQPTVQQAAQLRRISAATGVACRADAGAGLR
ncbi:MAG: hypothetical protein QOE62_2585 [Actinomycetota bacterium]|nr:hypothetical protein [Actinomycetota bacterium]